MPSGVLQRVRRPLVSILLELAAAHDVGLQLTLDSSDQAITRAFRRVSVNVHPDKSTRVAWQQTPSA